MSDTTIVVVRDPEITVVVREDPTTVVAVSAPGPQGPPGADGPQGPPGAGTSSFTFEQNTPADVWTIDHGLGYVPNWFVVESTGDELEPGRSDPSANQTIFDFDGVVVSGIAYAS